MYLLKMAVEEEGSPANGHRSSARGTYAVGDRLDDGARSNDGCMRRRGFNDGGHCGISGGAEEIDEAGVASDSLRERSEEIDEAGNTATFAGNIGNLKFPKLKCSLSVDGRNSSSPLTSFTKKDWSAIHLNEMKPNQQELKKIKYWLPPKCSMSIYRKKNTIQFGCFDL